ncbi:hypothetical protein F4678DRAFT_438923 [Xylaria arbuscula]|nr:hypothetical protein F4678DRAFT_438923 [Xylaria arbuscula]
MALLFLTKIARLIRLIRLIPISSLVLSWFVEYLIQTVLCDTGSYRYVQVDFPWFLFSKVGAPSLPPSPNTYSMLSTCKKKREAKGLRI